MATLKHAFNAKDMNSLVYRIIEGKLQEHMGEKYASYGAKVRHLKFLEENMKF